MTVRYLEAKRTVDDRSLATRGYERLAGAVPESPRIVEAGCGTGVTVPRLLSWGIDRGHYRGIDTDPAVIDYARRVRPAELRRRGWSVAEKNEGFQASDLTVTVETGDALSTLESTSGVDLVVAQQLLDLVDLDRALDAVTGALAPGGLAYFPLTFDGCTIFRPAHPDDAEIIPAYHRTMDDRPTGNSKTGRLLAERLQRRSGDLLVMAASDGIVRPRNGAYPADERYFLDSILDFFESELTDRPIDHENWLATRRDQLAAGELLSVAHRYDFLYQVPE